jgi:hypothetical protein
MPHTSCWDVQEALGRSQRSQATLPAIVCVVGTSLFKVHDLQHLTFSTSAQSPVPRFLKCLSSALPRDLLNIKLTMAGFRTLLPYVISRFTKDDDPPAHRGSLAPREIFPIKRVDVAVAGTFDMQHCSVGHVPHHHS